MSVRFATSLRPVLIAGVLGLSASAAFAQDAYDAPYNGAADETVTVTAPRFHTDTMPLNAPPERAYLSRPISYTKQDLLDPTRSQVLRWKVWRTAHEVCDQLREEYPVYRMSTAPTCFREAYENAITKIDARMAGARLAYWYGY